MKLLSKLSECLRLEVSTSRQLISLTTLQIFEEKETKVTWWEIVKLESDPAQKFNYSHWLKSWCVRRIVSSVGANQRKLNFSHFSFCVSSLFLMVCKDAWSLIASEYLICIISQTLFTRLSFCRPIKGESGCSSPYTFHRLSRQSSVKYKIAPLFITFIYLCI